MLDTHRGPSKKTKTGDVWPATTATTARRTHYARVHSICCYVKLAVLRPNRQQLSKPHDSAIMSPGPCKRPPWLMRHYFGLNLRDFELTQCRSFVGVGKPCMHQAQQKPPCMWPNCDETFKTATCTQYTQPLSAPMHEALCAFTPVHSGWDLQQSMPMASRPPAVYTVWLPKDT